MKKLGYRKSRNGCLLCKKRRVKCDEQRPCGACARHGVSCSLGDSGLTDSRSARKEAFSSQQSSPGTQPGTDTPPSVTSKPQKPIWLQAPSKERTHSGLLGPAALDLPFLQASTPDSTDGSESPEYSQSSLIDLELMHHYSLHAYKTFPHTSLAPKFFQEDVPKLALRHSYLLHQVLAVSGYHLMHINPDLPPDYLHRTTHHLTKALSGIRAALGTEISHESSTALFAASSLLLSSTYASRQYLANEGALDNLVGMVVLYRGIGSIQTTAAEQLSKDLLQEVFGNETHQQAMVVEPWTHEYTAQLNALKHRISIAATLPPDVKKIALDGAQVLLDVPLLVSGNYRSILTTVEVRILYRWPFSVADDFLRMVREQQPVVLAVLLFYGAIMRMAEEECWFLKGWAPRVADAALKALEGTPWLEYTQWALNVIRR